MKRSEQKNFKYICTSAKMKNARKKHKKYDDRLASKGAGQTQAVKVKAAAPLPDRGNARRQRLCLWRTVTHFTRITVKNHILDFFRSAFFCCRQTRLKDCGKKGASVCGY
jgi:hypothetical protein